jgi:DNA-binding CsgD family transcriptional regulator
MTGRSRSSDRPLGVDWSSLTRREAEVLEAVRERLTNAEVGARFFISERTVESHV